MVNNFITSIPYYDNSLTPKSCAKRGYHWIRDLLYCDKGTIVIFQDLFNRGYKLGKAKELGRNSCGFYVPKDIVAERLSNIFNPILRPENAKGQGYEYIDDVIYNIITPNDDILNLIKDYGYKLGNATQEDDINSFFGLYMPQELIK